MAEDMATLASESEIWKQIDLSESYMVCFMFEEAASLAASVVKQMRTTTSTSAAIDDTQVAEMMESAGMVFVQSLKELGRTGELFGELKELFGTVQAIPVQVFLTGGCMQISEGYSSNLKTTFEEFLDKWVYLKDEVNVLPKAELQSATFEKCIWQAAIPVERYLEVADVYALTVLGMVLRKPDVTISWTERAGLPEEKCQPLHLAAQSNSSLRSGSTSMAERSSLSVSGTESFPRTTQPQHQPNDDALKPATLKSIERISDQTIGLKFGNFRFVLPRGKTMFLVLLMLVIFYAHRKRRAVLKRFVTQQFSSIRRALIDARQLAFSVQVNPLAAVQQLPSAAPRGRR